MGCCGKSGTGSALSPELGGCGCDQCQGCSQESLAQCPPVIDASYSVSIKVSSAWNVPRCQESVTVIIDPEYRAPIGTFLWNYEYGYFLVNARNTLTGQTQLINVCFPAAFGATNAVPGTPVPACSKFILGADPTQGVFTGDFLAEDFVAPALGVCTTITLTSNALFAPGMLIRLGTTYIYKVSEIYSNGTTIVICNEGGGFPAGFLVTARSSTGNFLYPATLGSEVISLSLGNSGGGFGVLTGGSVSTTPEFFVDVQITGILKNPFLSKSLQVYSVLNGLLDINCPGENIAVPSWSIIRGTLYFENITLGLINVNESETNSVQVSAIAPYDIPYSLSMQRSIGYLIPPNTSYDFLAKMTVGMGTTNPDVVEFVINRVAVAFSFIGVPT